ncbi:MAG: alanyl-tRNA editing protein [Thermoplasmatota archaeon]
MTELLYMRDLESGYERRFQARVVEASPDRVVLDRSLFYPLGGGQEWDTGTLTHAGRRLSVTEVTRKGLFVGEGHGLRPGDEVEGEIDWERRYAHMRMHTAQHLVSALAYDLFGRVRTVGNQIHRQRSHIDFSPIEFSPAMLSDLEAAANGAIAQGYALVATTMTRAEILAQQTPDRSNMDLLPASVTDLRVIRIGADVDLCPCAGTHVRNTRELGEFQVIRRVSKGAGKERLEYTLNAKSSGCAPDPSPRA